MELDRILEVITRNMPDNSNVRRRIGVQAAHVVVVMESKKNRAPQLMNFDKLHLKSMNSHIFQFSSNIFQF
jgi:hypothetical protein